MDKPETVTKILLTSLSAATAEGCTFPIDIVKTRLQLGGGGGGARAQSIGFVVTELWMEGRVLGFYSGVSPAVLRHVFYTPIRIVGYEGLRGGVGESVAGKAVCGGVSGVIAQIVASPADLIKVRMQADGRLLAQGLQPRYSGIFDAFQKIVLTEGLRGLWSGVIPNAQRAFLVNMGELTCYDYSKHLVIDHNLCNDNVFAHSLASLASGLSATALSCPADVVKTRMMNQAVGKEGMRNVYRSSYDCLVKTVKYEGLMALWKGFFPTWARLGPWQFVFWVSYEKFRQLSGLSSF